MIKSNQNNLVFLIRNLFLFLTFLIISKMEAQNNSSSPYSRFGIGDLQSSSFAESDGMASSGMAHHEPFNINFSNPASYSSLKLTTFEFGVSSNFTKFSETGLPTNTTNVSNISYIFLGFPVVANKWGASFGLLPYSNVGYKISDAGLSNNGDSTNFLYTGSGGINQIYLGNAFNIIKNLSIGLNISYLFGSIEKQNTVEFPSLSSATDTRITNTIHVSDLSYRLGLIYTIDSIMVDSAILYRPKHKLSVVSNNDEALVIANYKDTIKIKNKQTQLKKWLVISNSIEGVSFSNDKNTLYVKNTNGKLKVDSSQITIKSVMVKSDRSLSFGLTSTLNSSLSAKSDSLAERYGYDPYGSVFVHDTVNYSTGSSGRIMLPLSLGFGVSYRQGARMLLSAEASMQDWSKYSSFGQNDLLTNSMRMAAGIQIAPDMIQAKNFFKAILIVLELIIPRLFLI